MQQIHVVVDLLSPRKEAFDVLHFLFDGFVHDRVGVSRLHGQCPHPAATLVDERRVDNCHDAGPNRGFEAMQWLAHLQGVWYLEFHLLHGETAFVLSGD